MSENSDTLIYTKLTQFKDELFLNPSTPSIFSPNGVSPESAGYQQDPANLRFVRFVQPSNGLTPPANYALFRKFQFTNALIGAVSNQEIGSGARKLIVLIHGWNPKSKEDQFSVSGSPAFSLLKSALTSRIQGSQWDLVLYHWEKDSDTGASLIKDPTEAASNGHQHGQNLGELLAVRSQNLEKVHFIAHSAGAWVARSATRYLLEKTGVKVQVTLLDPFIPDQLPFNDTPLTANVMSVMPSMDPRTSGQLVLLENYYAIDDLDTEGWNPVSTDAFFRKATSVVFGWSNTIGVQERIDWGKTGFLGVSLHYDSHDGPIEFYTDTVNATVSQDSPRLGRPFDLSRVGWKRSMFYQELSVPATLAAPSSLFAVSVSSSQINLSWSDTVNETSFEVERRLASSSSWTHVTITAKNVTIFSDKGLTAGNKYFYRVCAQNSAGDNACSTEASATTQSLAGATYTLNIHSLNPSSGVTVSSFVGNGSSAVATTPTRGSFVSGTKVGVYALNRLPGGQVFQKWQLEDGSDYAFSPGIYITMNSGHTLTAIYGATPLATRILSNLTIEGPSSVDERSSARYRARATYTDDSPAYVDAQAQWEVSSAYAGVSAGLLDASAVSGDRQVEIKATFTADGVTKTDTKSVTIRNTDEVLTYTLTLSAQNGHITPSPNMRSYPADTQVQLTAYPDEGYVRSHWSGDASGTDRTVYVTMNGDKSVTAHFALDTSYGRLQVNLSPPQAVAEGAQWKYDWFTDWRETGNIQDGITPRANRYVHFKDVPGWITPDEIKTSIIGGQTTVTNATYREILGSVQVALSPDQARAAGARWRLNGGPWMESGVTLVDVSTEDHTVEFLTIPGWSTPPSQTVSVARGVTSTRSGDYGPPAGLPIITAVSPRTGPIAGGTTVTIDGANFQTGATVSFAGVAAVSVTVVSPTRITAVTPPRDFYGSAALALTSGGQTVTQANGFSYLNALGSNIELIGQFGGNVEAVAVVGNMVYYGEGPGLVVSDFANSAAPVERGRIALPAMVKDVVVVNGIAFVAVRGAGLYAVDVSTPTAPAIVGFFDTDDASGVAVSDGIAYVADGSAGLQILDVTNPAAIVRRGLLDTAGSAQRVSVGTIASKKYAFVAEDAEGDLALRVIDVTTPNSSIEVANVPGQSGGGFTDVKLVGTTLYVSDPSGVVRIFDVSNPTSLAQIGSRGGVGSSFIDVLGNKLYTCSGSGLRVADLSVLPVPTNLGVFAPGGSCYKLVVANGLAFAAMGSDGLKVVNVTNPASMLLRSAIQSLGGVEDVWVSAGVAFVGNDSGLHTVNVSNPARPVRLATLPGDGVTDFVVADGKATLVGGSKPVRIANVANPSSVSQFGTYANTVAYGVALMGSTPVLAGTADDLPKLDLLNISSPSAPQSDGSLLLDNAFGIAQAIAVSGSWAFVGRNSSNNGLDIVSLANPASPQKVGSASISSYIQDAAVSENGNFAYVACNLGIQVVDVTVKATPVLGQLVNPPQAAGMNANSLCVAGNRLFAFEGGFIFAFDISNPASPQIIAYYDVPLAGSGISVAGDLILVASGSAGLSILRLMDVDKPTVTITSPTANTAYSTGTVLLSLSGTASDDKRVTRVSWVNDRGGGGVANGTTSWQVPDIQLAAGINAITVTAEDANGSLATDSLTVTASLPDTAVPVVIITGPKPDAEFAVNTETIAVSGSASDNQSVASVIWSNDRGGSGSANLTGQNWSVTNLLLALGPNLIRVTATDTNGNAASDTAVIFFAPQDTNAPNIAIEFPTLNAVYETEFSTLSLSGTASDDSGVARIEWSNDRGGQGVASDVAPWSVNEIVLQRGLNVIEVTATDDTGNTSSDTLAVKFTVPMPEPSLATVTINAADAAASEPGKDSGAFTISRTGDKAPSLTVIYSISGTASNGGDYQTLSGSVTLGAGSASSQILVVPIDDVIVEGSETVLLTLSPSASYVIGTPSAATVTITDNDSTVGQSPSIAAIPDNQTRRNTDTDIISFSVSDGQSPSEALTVSATSDNQTLLPGAANFQFVGSGTERLMIIRPASNQSGTANITVTITDPQNNKSSTTFKLTVLATAPTLSQIPDRQIPTGGSTGPIAFRIQGGEGFPGFFVLSVESSNKSLVADSGVTFGGSPASFERTVTVTPNAGETGSSTITITVRDAYGQTGITSFRVAVEGGGSAPATPMIRAFLSGNNLLLLWPESATGYRVESTSSLSPPVTWINVAGNFQTVGGLISIVLPITGGQKFYRLVRP